MCKTVKVEGFFPWLQYFEGKTSPCRIDKCNPCLANLISWNCSVDVVCTKLCARVQLVFLVRTNFVRRPFHWSTHIQSSAHFQYLEFFWVVRFQHNESLKSFDSLGNYVIFSMDFSTQGQSMSSTSCLWQIERMELIQGRGCSPVLAKTSLCQFWSHSTCRRAPFLIWGPLWTELPPTALKELSLPFEFKICILWISMLYFHLLQALPSPETIRRKDFQFETLKTWQECYEIWFCSSQPSMVHWLSSPIFPFLFVRRPAMVTSSPPPLLPCPRPPNPYIFWKLMIIAFQKWIKNTNTKTKTNTKTMTKTNTSSE